MNRLMICCFLESGYDSKAYAPSKINSPIDQIDMSSLDAGIYIVRLKLIDKTHLFSALKFTL